jgi:hypothetical protein
MAVGLRLKPENPSISHHRVAHFMNFGLGCGMRRVGKCFFTHSFNYIALNCKIFAIIKT